MTASGTILVVEDGPAEREAMARMLRLEGFDVLAAENPQQAMQFIDEPIDLILSDLRMGKSSGLDLLGYWADRHPETPFIMVTAYGEVDSAVAAMKLGATDYLTKPVHPDQLLDLIQRFLAKRPRGSKPPSSGGPVSAHGLPGVVGSSAAMLDVYEQTRRAAQTESTVLIRGESGTGKELIAKALHDNSPRHAGSFVVVNMAAIPDTLVESELFGHVRGSFTGAAADRAGRFEMANGGTIFIDEIGDFPAPSQPKLLRVLENRTATRVGANQGAAVDVRVVAATSRNLESMVHDGEFREDLYYRLHVVVINLPPLRDRRDDIPLLADYFLRDLARANGMPQFVMDRELLQFLQAFHWPGNVRQLRNCLESMVVMARGSTLLLDDLPKSFVESRDHAAGAAVDPQHRTLDDLERATIMRTLRQHGGNRTHAAQALGISVRTLQRRLRDWELRYGTLDEP